MISPGYFPADDTGDALRRIAKNGFDLTRLLKMEFFVAVPDEDEGQKLAGLACAEGLETSVEQSDESQRWTCYCTKVLVADYNAVLAFEEQLDNLARPLGGHSDGFGTFGNAT